MGCCISSITNLVVLLVNMVFFLVGAGVMSFGIIVLANPTLAINGLNMIPGFDDLNYVINVQQTLLNSGVILTVVGSIVLIISFIGLLGSCLRKKAQCILKLYSLFVLLTIFVELALLIYSAVDNRNIETKVENMMYSSLQTNFEPVTINNESIQNGSTAGAVAWETMQFKYACCGAHNYSDYQSWTGWQTGTGTYQNGTYQNATVPPSCCAQAVQYVVPGTTAQFINLEGCIYSPQNQPMYMNSQGCYAVFVNKIALHGYYVVIILASLVALEIIVLVLSICVSKSDDKNSKSFM